MPMSNQAILEAANAAVTRGDYDAFLAYCTDDTVWTFVGDTVLRGKAAVREWMTKTYREPPQLTVHQFITEKDFLIAMGDVSMTDENGQPTHFSYCDVWRLRDGKLAELQAYVIEKK